MNGIYKAPRPNIERRGPSALACSERFHLTSSIVGQTYVIDVARPLTLITSKHPVPVIYVLDGNSLFALTCQIGRLLEIGSDGIPPAVVVGIGYPTESSPESNRERRTLRVRDLTPTADDHSIRRIFTGSEGFPPSLRVNAGGAENFRSFIKEELQPFISAELKTDALDQTLVGMSLGGLFALDTLFSAPCLFARWIAVSPSIWWDHRVLFNAEAGIEAWPKHSPARVFLSVGGGEEPEMRLDVLELADRLRNRHHAGLQMEYHQFPGETHQSVFPGAVSRGLRAIFGSQPLS